MTRITAAVVVFLALLAVVAGLYASGPKYVVYCDPGHTLKRLAYADPSLGYLTVCQSKYGSESRGSKIRRTNAWERIKFSIVGSKNTRG